MTLEGHVLNGAIGTAAGDPAGRGRVRVEVLTAETAEPSLFDRLGDLAGKATNLPPDASAQHDHYLYGAPKSS